MEYGSYVLIDYSAPIAAFPASMAAYFNNVINVSLLFFQNYCAAGLTRSLMKEKKSSYKHAKTAYCRERPFLFMSYVMILLNAAS